MLLPRNDGSWKPHETGDRIVCQPTHDPSSRYYAIVSHARGWSSLEARLLEDRFGSDGYGALRIIGQNEVLGYVGHPFEWRYWAGDVVYIKERNRDGSVRKDGRRFAHIVSVDKQCWAVIQRFDQKTQKWAKAKSKIECGNWMRLGNVNVAAERDYCSRLMSDAIECPDFPDRPVPPAPPPKPNDPRHYTRQAFAQLLSVPDGRLMAMQRFEHSTPYPDQFLRNLSNVQSGKCGGPGWQSVLVYYGPPDSRIPGSDSGDVLMVFDQGTACLPLQVSYRPGREWAGVTCATET